MPSPPSSEQAVRAVTRDRYGDESVIAVRDVARPERKAGRVHIRVTRASIGPDVWHILTGLPLAGRLAFGLRRPRSNRLGSDFAGVVIEADSDSRFAAGDRVVGTCPGAFADEVSVDPTRLSHIPDTVSDSQAAALPTSGATAHDALAKADSDSAATVLVIGATGGIGHLALQLAATAGASVTAVCRPEAADLAMTLGADDVIPYTTASINDGARRWDAIIDTAGRRPIKDLRAALNPGGRIVIVGGEGGGKIFGGFGRELLAAPGAALAGQRVRGLLSTASAATTGHLLDLVAAQTLRPIVHAEIPLADTADAIRMQRAGRLRGKIVLTVS